MTLFNENETQDTADGWANFESSTAPIEGMDIKDFIKIVEDDYNIIPYIAYERYKK